MKHTALLAQRKSLFWRIHFWAAMLASPFALLAALTGILYIFTPQIEARLYGHLDTVQASGLDPLPLDAAIAAAQAVAPRDFQLRYAVPAFKADDSVRVVFAPASKAPDKGAAAAGEHSGHQHGGAPAAAKTTSTAPADRGTAGAGGAERISRNQIVYVNPYTAQVLGQHGEMDRFGMWSKRLHSSLLQGEGWRWMIELGASWLMVMLLTGVYLWWPRGSQKALPAAGVRGRLAWKQWHAFIGVTLSVMSVLILTTGLTWSKYAGEQIRGLRDATGQAPPSVPRNMKSAEPAGQQALTWDAAWQAAKAHAPLISMQITPPRAADGVWRIGNFDRGQPEKRFDLLLDAYSAKPLYYAGWDKQTAFSKATAIGIPFHRGEFGWWNQALLLTFGLGVLFSLLSGWVMFFKRRRQGWLGLPPLVKGAWMAMPWGGWVAAGVMFAAMPLLAVSAVAVALMEVAVHWRQRTDTVTA